MAKRRKSRRKMFKQLNATKFENLGATGSWNSIGYFEKLQDSMKSAYVDYVKISFILEGDSGGQDEESRGYLWCASNKTTLSSTDSDNTEYIISGAAAGNTGGGEITLPIKRTITFNQDSQVSSDGRVYVHVRATDTGSENLSITMIVESYGRMHTFIPL